MAGTAPPGSPGADEVAHLDVARAFDAAVARRAAREPWPTSAATRSSTGASSRWARRADPASGNRAPGRRGGGPAPAARPGGAAARGRHRHGQRLPGHYARARVPHATVVATDISRPALTFARANAAARRRSAVAFVQTPLSRRRGGPFDLIVANPPYVADADLALLPPEVWAHEPDLALSAGPDGLRDVRVIIGAGGHGARARGRAGDGDWRGTVARRVRAWRRRAWSRGRPRFAGHPARGRREALPGLIRERRRRGGVNEEARAAKEGGTR